MAKRKSKYINHFGWVGIFALAGCFGLIFALIALFGGLWIDDNLLGRRGPVTICLLVLSVPLNTYLMIKVAFVLVPYLRPLNPIAKNTDDEEV